ncbi:NAD(P)-binding protein [candidate division GN15 bacterium]|nr:NAD(P)-binding protein [candidate division GN15 bacterium]
MPARITNERATTWPDAHQNARPGTPQKHRVVIVGGGFGGLYAAKSLRRADVDLTVIDRRNFHLFQPLLYQVATGGLSPADISSPLRAVLKRQKNTRVLLGEVVDIDPSGNKVILTDGTVPYDSLIIATGASHDYFGNAEWEERAPGLKTVEDAIEIRKRIFLAFEAAEREPDPVRKSAWLTFVVVGGGPTGVEMAGAIGEIAHHTLRHDFRSIDPSLARIILVEGVDRILTGYAPSLSHKAKRSLERLGVEVRLGQFVTSIDASGVTTAANDDEVFIPSRTVVWGAGVKASPLSDVLTERTGVETDRAGRILVAPDLSIPSYPNIFVIGDLASFSHQTGQPLPGVAPVAMSQGRYAARLIVKRLKGRELPPYRYFDKGTMATIGRAAAVAQYRSIKLSGWPAWLIWLFVHLMYLVEFDNRLLVLTQWAWNYITRNRGARLITGKTGTLVSATNQPADEAQSEAEATR